MRPFLMPVNRFAHFYLGGARITDLRGVPGPGERSPEEWLASTTTRFGEDRAGLSVLPDGTFLRDAVEADPDRWLGSEHHTTFGTSTGILVKLLDAGQRLPVHLHPDRVFARRHLDCPYGKTEAWYVVEADRGAHCHLGFTREVAREELARAVAAQDSDALLALMHRVDVRTGDGILVPAGLPHAIGAGILVVEAQEPTDFSVLLEWEGFAVDGERDGHLGLGFATALEATNRHGLEPASIARLVRSNGEGGRTDQLIDVLPGEASPFFRVGLARPLGDLQVDAGFAVVVVLAGTGTLVHGSERTPVGRGDVVAMAHAVGPWALEGGIAALVCRPARRGPLTSEHHR